MPRYNTVVKRWPVIITNLIDTVYRAIDTEGNGNPNKIAEGKAVISRLAKLKYDMSHDRPLEYVFSSGFAVVLIQRFDCNRHLQTDSRRRWFEFGGIQ
jgi:hypothetical protein